MTRVPAPARWLGVAGLLPQLAVVAMQIGGDPGWVFSAQALGFAYAALILSFLGGLWWGLAAASAGRAPVWLWIASVVPSLVALASAWPWAAGKTWPGPSLVALGVSIVATLAVDRALVRARLAPDWWMQLRVPLSLGLGGLTIASGLLA